MAAFSSSPSLVANHQISYDAFVSFRGSDCRSGFLSHLTKAFDEKGIDAYVDDRLEKGEELSLALLKAIEESQISLIVFSPNYASSTWCLEELAKIIECREQNSQTVIPVFYQIEPSDVRHQMGDYGIPFGKHEQRYGEMTVKKWRAASKKAANLSGFSLSNFKGTEAEFIEEIIKSVEKILENDRIQKYYKNLVGIHRRIAPIELLLCKGSKEICIVGIWGPGGIGKSTIARSLFSKLLFKYRGCCCVIYLREELEKNQIADIKMKLYSQLLKKKIHEIPMTLGLPDYVTRRLERRKVLILLDDVYELEHLKILIHEEKNLFGLGSVIIVTSRDKQLLYNVAGDRIYEVEALNDNEALQHLSLNIFKQENLKKKWMELLMRVIGYAQGNPLALTVLGSALFGLNLKEGQSLLKRLGKIPCEGIQKVLRLSYDRLEREDRRLFLLLSCFFRGMPDKKGIGILLDACGFSSPCGLKNLENKALIKIENEHLSSRNKCVQMHGLIREMGKEIVREESFNKLGKRSHLWDAHDIYQVLMNNTGTEAIESIILDMRCQRKRRCQTKFRLKPQVFKKMVNLKLLKFHGSNGQCTLHFPEGLESLPNQLRLFHWEGYPLKSLPLTFCAKYLVDLNMRYSRMENLWDGIQDLENLKTIDLSYSPHLIKLPDLSKALKLKIIDLSHCCSLVEVHESIFSLHQLEKLLLSCCKKLKSLKSDILLKSLRRLSLSGCVSLEVFSVISKQMVCLFLDRTAIVELPSSIKFLEKLQILSLRRCENLRHLPDGLCKLGSLRELDLYGPINLDSSNLCILLNCLKSLISLRLSNCYNLGELPKNAPLSLKHLSRLRRLSLENCRKLQSISDLPPSIKGLHISNCERLQSIIGLPLSIEDVTAANCESLKTVTSLDSMLKFHNGSNISSYYSLLCYRNCINLDEHAVNNIIENFLYKIKQISSQFSLHQEGREPRKRVQVCLPEWKVPDWFSHREKGALITVPLDICAESMCIGFICCIIVSDSQSNRRRRKKSFWEYHCRVKGSNEKSVLYYRSFHRLFLDHMFLWYDLRSFSQVIKMRANDRIRTHEERVSLEFKFRSSLVIKECGVHPIYASEYFNPDDLLQLKKHNWKFLAVAMESKSGSTLPPTHKTLVPRATESWKNETRGLKQVLEF